MNGKKPSNFQFHFHGQQIPNAKKMKKNPLTCIPEINTIYPISDPGGKIFLVENVDFL
jgi:hypothetical protein